MILMTILAEADASFSFVSLKDVADKMGLSMKFLEEIAAALKKAKLVVGRKGPGGGYKLAKDSKEISIYEILVALEGPITAMSCDGAFCPVSEKCSSKNLWGVLHEDLIKTLKKKTLHEISKI